MCPVLHRVNENTNAILIIYESKGLMRLKVISVSQRLQCFTFYYLLFLNSIFTAFQIKFWFIQLSIKYISFERRHPLLQAKILEKFKVILQIFVVTDIKAKK